MSTTPRTDEIQDNIAQYLYKDGEVVMMVPADFARQLENELHQTKLALESVNKDCTILEDSYKRAMAIGLEQKAKIKWLQQQQHKEKPSE